jgi:hypothetical protein
VTFDGLIFGALLAAAALLDGLVRPRAPARPLARHMLGGRSLTGLWLLAWLTIGLFGLFLAATGNAPVAAGLTLALLGLFVAVSNAKHTVLGEPLLFTDLALIGAIFRHPQFYLSAIRIRQRVVAALTLAALLASLGWLFVPAPRAHLIGLGLFLASGGVLALSLGRPAFRRLAQAPDADGDVRRHGLLPTLLLYWLRWRESRDPPPCDEIACPPRSDGPELVVVVQCESFADPAELFADSRLALPGLAAARNSAAQWGQLEVSGFGAYTMRTEYGVLFGRSETALGFRRYDPFLTAVGEASYALPARLKGAGWRSLFAHPHDLRFYGRDRIMPAGGFAELVGQESFTPPAAHEGRYVTDAAVTEEIVSLAAAATGRTLIYAVTIENHGPWAPDASAGEGALSQGYLRLVRNGDAMLTTLLDRLANLRRPALLVFFGDHRPSIPGIVMPGGARHTPYVMVRLDQAGEIVRGANRRADLTPAQLHHAILDMILGTDFDACPAEASA